MPFCMSWENPHVCLSLYRWERSQGGWRAVPGPCFWRQTPHCFGTLPPPLFLQSSPFLILPSQERQLNKEVRACLPFFFLCLSLIKPVALGRFFLFVSAWQARDTATQNTSFLTVFPLPPSVFLFLHVKGYFTQIAEVSSVACSGVASLTFAR